MVQTTQNFELFDQKKKKKKKKKRSFKTIFNKALIPFWKTFLYLKQLFNAKLLITINFQTTIFQCSKQYDSLIDVTRLKVAPNMADSINTKDADSRLKGK